jgi:hypothetical protein
VPTFGSISPTSGPITGGTGVTIIGGNLNGATSVTFGGTTATGFTVVSGTSITATTPAHTAGAVNVIITTPNGTATGPGAFTYITPTFSSISPISGRIAGGTAVTITGGNLFGATAVTFDGTAATGFTVVSGTSITATTPAHAAGAVNVVITTPNGTATGTSAYTYVAPAPDPVPEPTGGSGGPGHGSTLSGVSPQSGATGTTVQTTITGTNFPVTTVTGKGATTQVKVWLSSQVNKETIMGQKVTVQSPTTLTCRFDLTGANPGPWTLELSRGSGWITAVVPDAFTVKPATAVPVIKHINPSIVKAGAKAFVITVTGEHFSKGNRVQWKGVARETTFVSDTTIKAKVLATDIAKAGRYVVSVYRPGRDAATSNGVSVNVRK